jgi:hypothetical protein
MYTSVYVPLRMQGKFSYVYYITTLYKCKAFLENSFAGAAAMPAAGPVQGERAPIIRLATGSSP